MNATSVLSSAGYGGSNTENAAVNVQTAKFSLDVGAAKAAEKPERARSYQEVKQRDQELASAERQVKSEEQNLKARAGGKAEVFTVYHYAMGADGKRYVTGASVTVRGDADTVEHIDDSSAAVKEESKSGDAARSKDVGKVKVASADKSASDKKEQEQIRKLKQIENEVVAHEAAHMASAGSLGGGVSYTYTQGPDGKKYITGGEVPIELKAGSTPQETIRNMQQVQRAALAPGDPSGQDRSVAMKAASVAAMARSQLAAENARKAKASLSKGKPSRRTAMAKGTPVFSRTAYGCDKSSEARQVINQSGSLKVDKSREASVVMNGVDGVKADYMQYMVTGQAAA